MTAIEHRFGPYGGQYVPETLMPALAELEAAWIEARDDDGFRAELGGLLRERRSKVPLILSGGLSPDNVAEAIEVARPYAVDTASGTEARPGVKDPEKMPAFAAAVASTAPVAEETADPPETAETA